MPIAVVAAISDNGILANGPNEPTLSDRSSQNQVPERDFKAAVGDDDHARLALIAAVGGRIDTRIKVQKEAYLLAALDVELFERSAFSYHYFGPYSRELSDALQFAVSSDLLTEIKEQGTADGVRYSYAL
jgi:hypothetical protein